MKLEQFVKQEVAERIDKLEAARLKEEEGTSYFFHGGGWRTSKDNFSKQITEATLAVVKDIRQAQTALNAIFGNVRIHTESGGDHHAGYYTDAFVSTDAALALANDYTRLKAAIEDGTSSIALILASGEGKRLRPLTENTNKAMLPVAGKPVLEHIVGSCVKNEITNIVFAVGYFKEHVMDYFRDGSKFNINADYSVTSTIPQTAGQVRLAQPKLVDEEDFLLHYGDTLTNLDLQRMYDIHKQSNAVITTAAMKEVQTESGIYVCSEDGTVTSFHEKPFVNDLIDLPGIFSNVPIYWINKRIWECQNLAVGKDFNMNVMPEFVAKSQVKVFYQDDLWHLDVGDLKKYQAICEAFEKGTQAELRKLA